MSRRGDLHASPDGRDARPPSADPPRGNLFTVGDIKQSIYRFRLAEPDLFAGREKSFDQGGGIGEVHICKWEGPAAFG